ncbi:MAG: T9SS type A sorting domain-containing protein [Bacteroidetes bacterium]|nr:T9SS type A sorting domain-containing protein [Bacteroidota bacterium]MBL0138531.1 T9SS type A sorting domain-containing protein [Bacteroidota bacterium]
MTTPLNLRVLILLFYGIMLLNVNYVLPQAPVIQWQRSYGGSSFEGMESIIQTIDNGFIACGITESSDGDVTGHYNAEDVWVIKIDSIGQLEWQKCLGGTGPDGAYSIIQLINGDYVITGTSWSTNGDVTGNHGKSDVWVVKLNSTGNIIWQRCFGGTEHEGAYAINSTLDGGLILTGTTDSNNGDVVGNHGYYDVWLIKLDSSGTLEWQKCLGGVPNDEGWAVVQTPDSGYVVGGKTDSNDGDVSGLHGFTDFWLVKVDKVGNFLWQSCYGGQIGQMCRDIKITPSGGFILTGETNSTTGMVTGNHSSNKDIWIVETDSLGQFIRQKCLGGTDQEDSYSILCTSDGGYLVGGYTVSTDGDVTGSHGGWNQDYWIIKLDSTLNIIWEQCYGGSGDEAPYQVIETSDSGIMAAGYSWSIDGDVTGNHGESDVWIIKLVNSTSSIGVTNKEDSFSYYPNPVTDMLHLNNLQENASVRLTTLTGTKIIEFKSEDKICTLDLSSLDPGIYILGVNDRKIKILKY